MTSVGQEVKVSGGCFSSLSRVVALTNLLGRPVKAQIATRMVVRS